MGIVFTVLLVMGLCLLGLRQKKFDWLLFAGALGGLALLAVAMPLFGGKLLPGHPGVQVALMLVGILAFVLGVTMWGLKRKRSA